MDIFKERKRPSWKTVLARVFGPEENITDSDITMDS